MIKKWVINQDRDEILELEDVRDLYVLPVRIHNKIMGFNLYLTEILLGTFDTLAEALIELNSLLNTKEEFYVVTGYNSYNY